MSRTLTIVLTLAAMVVFGAFGREVGDWLVRPNASGDTLEALQRQVAAELRQELPMRVDELTVWTAVAAAGATLIYTYRMDLDADDERLVGFDDRIQQLVTTGVCSTPGMVRTMGEGAVYEYH